MSYLTGKESLLKFNKPKYFSSFIDISSSIKPPKALFQWTASPGFRFDGEKTIVKTAGLQGEDKTNNLKSFSIVVKAKMTKNPGKIQTLVAHSGCGCYSLIINEESEIIFQERCNSDNQFRSGFRMPLDTFVTITFSYDTNNAAIFIVKLNIYNRYFFFYF